ncbi:Glycogen accumulation regulator GarA [Thalassocella blandensis]|nr:Glycogen accumulation regulator GarA [Thalassocella blandensis]
MVDDISQFMQANRRLEYGLLRQYAKKVAQDDFTKVIDSAVLVGSGVYSGRLDEHSQADQTSLFQKRYIDQDDDAAISLHSAIFYLSPNTTGNIISIGRSESNDIVLNDTSISREHAHIRIDGQRYYLTDFGATNSTMLNETSMAPNKETALEPGDNIGFGRYQFSFLTPERFFKWVHKY